MGAPISLFSADLGGIAGAIRHFDTGVPAVDHVVVSDHISERAERTEDVVGRAGDVLGADQLEDQHKCEEKLQQHFFQI